MIISLLQVLEDNEVLRYLQNINLMYSTCSPPVRYSLENPMAYIDSNIVGLLIYWSLRINN